MNDITALPQRMEEVDPRDAFEKLFPLPAFCVRCGTGYASTSFNGWDANKHQARWEGWKAAMALMESRTVTVKMPKVSDNAFWLSAYGRLVFREETYRSAVVNAICNAGIQVIEGEGQ